MGDKVSISKDALYGGVIAVLVILFAASVLTGGFGLVNACPPQAECPAAEPSQPSQPAQPAQPAETEEPAAEALGTLTIDVGEGRVMGDENAPVSLVHFSEFPCPYCQRFYLQTEGQLETNYVDTGKLKFYFRDFIVHPDYAIPAAQASRCAEEQGMFWEMHSELFDNRDTWLSLSNFTPAFIEYATDAGLDNESFADCLSNSTAYVEEIAADMNEGRGYGVQGTPSSFIIISKSDVDEASIMAAVDDVNAQYGGITLFENDNEYIVMVPGAYPYDVFSTIIDTVE